MFRYYLAGFFFFFVDIFLPCFGLERLKRLKRLMCIAKYNYAENDFDLVAVVCWLFYT